jgi:signal transduction histidine kinase/CheY-like chemotaxis protein
MLKNDRKLMDLFIEQPFSDEDGKKIISSYLKTILLVSVSILPFYVILKLIQSRDIHAADVILLGLELFFLLLLLLLKNGRLILTGILFLTSAWAALTLMAVYADGVKDIAVVGYIIIIFLATLFTGIRFAVVITGMSIIAVWIMGFIHVKTGILPKGDLPLNYSRDYTVLFILVLATIILFARSYHYSFLRINKELEERTRTEEKLSNNELVLKENNEELNRSNIRIRKMNEDLIIARDKAEEGGRLKSTFLQNISHEIRTPLNGIVGFVNLLQLGTADQEKQKEYLEYIKSCSGQLLKLVNDILDISKIESGSLEINLSECTVSEICDELKNEFLEQAVKKDLKLFLHDETANIALRSDIDKIRQVLNNLISNAIKFTPSGSISVNFSKSENSLSVSVSDTGIGLDDSLKEAVFDHFRQAEEGMTRNYEGSGLGLAISKGNIDFLGGRIWYTSESGKGSVFSFEVPVDFEPGSETRYSESPSVSSGRRPKILIAEDDDISAIYLKELLAPKYDVCCAGDGIEAIKMISSDPEYDCILMDLKMPGVNGYEAARKIRDIAPGIRIVAVTAFNINYETEKKVGISFDGYILKPVSKDDLFRAIKAPVL